MRNPSILLTLLSLPLLSLARTDLEGCISSETVAFGGASLIWYVPDTGEICAFLDCGGGRAPPKTTVPGCPQYAGSATYSPSFLPDFQAAETTASSLSAASSSAHLVSPPITFVPLPTSALGDFSSEIQDLSSEAAAVSSEIGDLSSSGAAAVSSFVSGGLGSLSEAATTTGESAASGTETVTAPTGGAAAGGARGGVLGVVMGVVAWIVV
ncbi:hypothetical protein M501DRAFT_1016135 [Patellaria atrata CBS 101060]|uniref:Siderophore biosynthesis enzyme n=1 Tax=Patellaria atrata CBS 101060 TaxID=1346257 RepID=A0A9P4VSY6_9PEZI|nr:hypothetical protein M501DRAFT_1016135 [Patellaria atrata CBS 101060]